MATSITKGYELQVTGTNVDSWGQVLNNDVINIIDSNLGGVVTKSLTNVNVDLNAAESQNLRLVLNGTLTGNVLIRTLAVGMTIIENACTGNFTVTFQKLGVGAPVAIPNGTNSLVTTGTSGNPAVVGVDFPAGTRVPFQQTTPPPGYTKDITTIGLNNSAMRTVTGAVVNGGSVDFTTAFNVVRTPTGGVGNTSLNETQIPPHQHFVAANVAGSGGISGTLSNTDYVEFGHSFGNSNSYSLDGTATLATIGLSSLTGGGQPHNHSLTMNAMNFDVKFFDFSIGIKQ